MTPAFVGFIVVALVGGAAEMASAFSAARKDRLDLSVGIALASAAQIALFVAPLLVLLSYVIGPAPMDLQFWPGAVVMMLIATMTATLVTNGGRSAWFVGVLVLMVYLIFAMTLYCCRPESETAHPDQASRMGMQQRRSNSSAHRSAEITRRRWWASGGHCHEAEHAFGCPARHSHFGRMRVRKDFPGADGRRHPRQGSVEP